MAQSIIAPLIPNMSLQGEAVAGSSALIFTATDRKIIEERTGEINDRKRSFLDVLAHKPLTPEVENEETAVKEGINIKELEGRYRDHRQMLKHATLNTSREQVEISGKLPDQLVEPSPVPIEPGVRASVTEEDKKVKEKTIAIAKELKLNASELFDKFDLEQRELFGLVSRIKEHHLKRLLSETQEEYKTYTEEIRKETISIAKPEAREWLEKELNRLTLESAAYKLKLLKSLQSMEINTSHAENIRWLQKIVSELSK